jgi:hypothetical protein
VRDKDKLLRLSTAQLSGSLSPRKTKEIERGESKGKAPRLSTSGLTDSLERRKNTKEEERGRGRTRRYEEGEKNK